MGVFKKHKKMILWIILTVILVIATTIFACNAIINHYAEGRIYEDIDSIPARETGLLLGCAPKSRITGGKNTFYLYRIDAAASLYKAGKIKNIIVSGSDNSYEGVDETKCMRQDLMAQGVPENAIITDGKGYRTLDSVVRAYKVFGKRNFTIISQEFHNQRTLYLAHNEGLDDVIAFNAKNSVSKTRFIVYARELLARVKVFVDILTNEQPQTLEK